MSWGLWFAFNLSNCHTESLYLKMHGQVA